MSGIFDSVFGHNLSNLKVKNLDSASLHEIINEFAPLLTGEVITQPKLKYVENDGGLPPEESDDIEMEDSECSSITRDSPAATDSPSATDSPDTVKPEEDSSGKSSSPVEIVSYTENEDGALDLSLHSTRENSSVHSHQTSVINGNHSINHSTHHSIEAFQEFNHKIYTDPVARNQNEPVCDLTGEETHSIGNSSTALNLHTATVDHLTSLKNGVTKMNCDFNQYLLTANLSTMKALDPERTLASQENSLPGINVGDLVQRIENTSSFRGSGRYKMYHCEHCPNVYDTKYHLNRHIMSSHEGVHPFVCEVCSKPFAQKCDLTRHMNVHYNMKKHVCKVCNKSFKRADYLIKHEKEFCSTSKPLRCEKCGKCFAEQSKLDEHMSLHEEKVTFDCDKCDASYIEEGDLYEHEKQHEADKPQACPKCEKIFPEFKDFVLHYKEHSGERPYQCALCDKVFTRNHNLMTHLWIHNKHKNHSCPTCKKTFTYYSNLQVHIRVHTGERPYRCGDCDKSFLTSSDLRRHHRIHSGDKPYICKSCKMAFTRKERLLVHQAKERHG